MNNAGGHKFPLKFFLLVFALTIPFYVFGALAGFNLTPDLPVSVLMVVVPATAAAILVHRELGSAGVIDLLKDRSITNGSS